ncbi:uncharacterized protein [Anabrus simplex]|uniref:uncharacterized protein isoform X2 n=1 Tax=Anabrus simplex TaxID=316456 RepID=UPI0035A26EC6
MDLPQVGKILSEIENTQKEIEYKLKYKGQVEGRDSSVPENGIGHFEQISQSDANRFSSQNNGLYQFINTGTQLSHPLESSSVILPRVETQPPPSVSTNCTLNQDLSKTYHSSNILLNQSSANFQNTGAIKERAVSTSKQGAETCNESASTCNFDSNGKNSEVHHSFVQYPNMKSHIENDGCVRKQVSFETSKNLQETDPISFRELGFDIQDLKLHEKMSFEPKKLSSFGSDSVGLPVYSTFPITQSVQFVSKQNRPVDVEPPTEYTDSQERIQHRSKEQIYEPIYNRPGNKRVEFTCQKDSAVAQSELRAGSSEASGDLPKALPRAALTDSGHGLSVGTSSSSANLLSLSDLWGSETKLVRNEHMTLEQRLEEEKYRRQHCEDLIRHLQSRLLEEQQRLAVAVRVDRGKDQAILQLQDAWARLVAHWRELEEQRHHLAGQLSAQRSIHQQEMAEMAQKVKRYEQELSKVLDLAQGYKDKCDVAEQTRRETEEQHSSDIHGLESKIQEGQHLLAETGRHIEEISQENIALKEKLKSAEEATLKEKQMLLKSQNEAKEISKKLNNLEADIAALREENNSLQLRLKEERSRSNLLEQQKKTALTSIEESKKKEKSLRDELKEKSDMVEKVKLDLRDYYQEQVEAVVREKLQEFQTQLDNAEASLQREMEERDKAASEAAAKQVQHITDKHQLEVRLLEEKHKEELQLYKLQLTQATQQISQLQVRLQSYSNKKTEIVEKLQGVMEAQWKEALRIIGGSSPVVSSSVCHPRFLQGEKERGDMVPKMQPTLQFLTTSQPNLDHHSASKSSQGYESHITHKTDPAAPFEIPVRDGKNDRVPLIHVSQSSEGSSTADEMPFGKEGQLTYRVSQSSKSQSTHVGKDHDLQKYIKMLLNRSPGYPVDGSITASSVCTSVSERKLPPDWDRPEATAVYHPRHRRSWCGTPLSLFSILTMPF